MEFVLSAEGMGEGVIRSDNGLTLETSANVSFTASITLINTQLTHQLVLLFTTPGFWGCIHPPLP